jgi:putative oxidoreductase
MDLFDRIKPHVLALFRIVVGLLFASHGAAALFGVLGGAKGGKTPEFLAFPGWWAAVIQLVAGVLVLFGLVTRWAALLASGSMAYAYFTVHAPQDLWPMQNGGEPSAMFCWAFLLIAFFGPGAWAVDQVFSRSSSSTRAPATA